MKNNENNISKMEENQGQIPVIKSEINENDNNESNIIKGLLNNMNDDENNMELENEEDNDNNENKIEIQEEDNNINEEENKISNNDDKSKFRNFLINLLKNNNFLQQRAVKMTITNFLELLNLLNNNGIHFN